MEGRCKTCDHWGVVPSWADTADRGRERFYSLMRDCCHPARLFASAHCARPDYEGGPTTHPDFGCVQWAPKAAGG